MRGTRFVARGMALALGLALALGAAPAHAGKPDHAGKGKNGSPGKSAEKKSKGGGASRSQGPSEHGGHKGNGGGGEIRFTTSVRSDVHEWYEHEYHGHCPPGLAKKHNGCLPPGLAKKRYVVGQPLPPGIVIGIVPPSLAVILGPPPIGYRYGMIDGDIVKLAIGTALVVDAIDGLMN